MRSRSIVPERTELLGIIGNPVRASLSPRMQNAALRHLRIDALYLPFELTPDAVRDVLRALPRLGFRGVNVTIPYKETVLRWLDHVEEGASDLGAVNTIVVDRGRLLGYNTDGPGFLMALQAEGRIDPRGDVLLIVGAGGVARAIAFEAARRGCGRIWIANRTRARAESLRRVLRRHFPAVEAHAIDPRDGAFPEVVAGSVIIVNTTPLGSRKGDPLPVPAAFLTSSQVVMDIVYRPVRTPLLAAAEAAGCRCLNGLGMLLYQGALAFRLWTGKEAPLDVMRQALLTVSGVRGQAKNRPGARKGRP